MSTITREIDLTPSDVVQVLRAFSHEEWQELKLEIQASLFLENVDSDDFAELLAWLYQEEQEAMPEEPPATPEGDQIALEAVKRMAGSIPITDPELGRWIAESPDLLLYNDDDFKRVPGIKVWMPR